MRRSALGTAVFFLLAPGVVAGLVPWLITRWEGAGGSDVLDLLGAALDLGGLAVVVMCFARFVVEGHGTPAPVAPTERLVVGGLYRWVRNPMYVGVGASIAGQAVLFRSLGTAGWLVAFMVAVGTFVVGYEQPTLRRRYGAAYVEYCRAVPAWWPRLRPWTAP